MNENMRLDVYVVGQLPERPRTYARRLIDDGKVMVNGKVTSKASYHLKPDDKVKIQDDYEQTDIPKIDIPIIYEDDDCVVIDKLLGLLSHSKGAYNPEATVATWLQNHLQNPPKDHPQKTNHTPEIAFTGPGPGNREGIVHRLDRATSGVMICAKTEEAQRWLQKQFSTRKVKKTYLALIEGTLNPDKAIIDMPIERNPKKPQTFRVGANGKTAITAYEVIKTIEIKGKRISLVELKPTTGRTHQLRVHLKHLGHPIVGDTFYDGITADRLYLHAHQLELTLPNRERKTFTSKLPIEFEKPKL